MKFVLTPEQVDVASVAAKFLQQQLPLPRVRELADAAEAESASLAVDDATWAQCAEMGWFALGVPESLGGLGCGPVEEIMLFTELGRHLAPGPFVSTAAAAWVAAATGERELAASIFEGRLRAGLEVGGFILDGEPGGLVVRFVGANCELLEIGGLDPVASVDPSVRLARGSVGLTVAQLEDPLLLPRAQLLVSAMELGIAQAVRDMSVEYAKVRTQFGKPIGAFQAVKHRCSDMAIRCHAARGQSLFAAFHVESRAVDAEFQAAAAKMMATKAAKFNTADNVQNHGAIGFTVEHDAGLFARRAHMYEFALGGNLAATPVVLSADRHRFETLPAPVEQWFGQTRERAALRVVVDSTVCEGHALCVSFVPEVFELADNDRSTVLDVELTDELLESVEEAIVRCPVQAISLQPR
jgi:alkylation response protein AidB-like acyl-CoA dehydrogenase/ferredoxin